MLKPGRLALMTSAAAVECSAKLLHLGGGHGPVEGVGGREGKKVPIRISMIKGPALLSVVRSMRERDAGAGQDRNARIHQGRGWSPVGAL